jgi:hypothetical protein
MIIEHGPEQVQPAPKIVPGSPADSGVETVPVPDPAPGAATTTTTAYQPKKRRSVYYPYGRIRPR